VIDVGRQLGVGLGIVERRREEHVVDGLGGRLHPARPGEIFRKGLPDKVPQGDPASPGHVCGTPVEIRGEKELCPAHV
jgi:hypothetical protein